MKKTHPETSLKGLDRAEELIKEMDAESALSFALLNSLHEEGSGN